MRIIRFIGPSFLLLACATQAATIENTLENITLGDRTSRAPTTVERIEVLVREAVTKRVADEHSGSYYTITPQPIPAATRLKHCDHLKAEIRSKNLHGRVPVHIRCVGPAPWALYATAIVSVEVPVIVASRAISRGERIEAAALMIKNIPLHRLRPQTVSELDDALGKIARRALPAHQPITLHHLSTPPVVAKGDRVQILAHAGRVSIQAFGVALANGQAGEQIQVRNETSDRVIRPWVLSQGKVATAPPSFRQYRE